ncbi:MAG TPA: glycoside hydrolase, partial [Clostridia bacterium]|nr:glycoside hydrolase [Clostridia bacterium]
MLIEKIRKNSDEYGSIPFWSWNDKLDPEELRRQINVMKKIGMNGFFMHARGGLETDYLSDDWYDCIRQCVDEAKKLGMEAWSYDENGWPSGFAGGKLLEDKKNHATYL